MSVRSSDGKNFRRVARTAGDRVPAVGIRRNKAFYTATGGELSLDLQTLTPQISYQPGQAQLEVKSSSGPMIEGLDYYETSATTITFPSPGLSFGEVLEITQAFQYSGNLVAQVRPDEYSEVAAPGQTSVTTDFSWPLNQNPAKRHGAIMVYLNGILQQRGASQDYVEVSLGQANTNQIQFNSAMIGGENISIVRAHQAIDETAASTQFNNVRLAELQEHFTKGFQAIVDESATIDVPYTSIVGRAKIPNIANDLKVSFGIDRIKIQSIYKIDSEFGPNGEPVWGAVNDDKGLIRFVGAEWTNLNDTNSYRAITGLASASTTEYVEVTFYGTGLNMVGIAYNSSNDFRVSVDGGAEGANILGGAAYSGVYSARKYAWNQSISLVSNLPLGIHTVKLRKAGAGANTDLNIYGFEIINTSSSTALKINPGYAFAGGRKITSLTGSSSLLAKPATVTGGRGGRVVVYQNPDGSFGQSVQIVDSVFGLISGPSVSSASHTSEEIARTYSWREFSAGRSDDFGTLPIGGFAIQDLAFTLDDNTTTLFADLPGVFNNGLYATGAGGEIRFTFVGTGLDIQTTSGMAATTSNTSIIINGTTVATPQNGYVGGKTYKIASNLRYGTHTVSITNGIVGNYFVLDKFIVYQPKKPSIPTGAIELADYNVMADFAANNLPGINYIATGVLRKMCTREMVLANPTTVGSTPWSITSVPVSTNICGFQLFSDYQNAYLEYTFFGTGFDKRFEAAPNKSSNISVYLQNLSAGGSLQLATTANFPTLTSSFYGTGVNFVAGVLDQQGPGAVPGSGLRISNLPLALYKVQFKNNTASTFIGMDAIDIITPIHSYKSTVPTSLQNSLPVGSYSLADSRVTSLVKSDKNAKNWAQAVGAILGPTTNSNQWVPIPDMSVTISTGAGGKSSSIKISYSIDFFCDLAGRNPGFRIYLDGTSVGQIRDWISTGTAQAQCSSDNIRIPVSPGVHKIEIYWTTNAGTLTANSDRRTLLVEELE